MAARNFEARKKRTGNEKETPLGDKAACRAWSPDRKIDPEKCRMFFSDTTAVLLRKGRGGGMREEKEGRKEGKCSESDVKEGRRV
jgi:hypothetical protein